jgi:hypothetical protein
MHVDPPHAPFGDCRSGLGAEAFRELRLAELARMREVGIRFALRIEQAVMGELGAADIAELAGKDGLLPRFFRTQRAVRQIVVLEMELLGLRPAPDRDRVRDAPAARDRAAEPKGRPDGPGRDNGLRCDYDSGPYDQVVARVRRELGTAAPANDPFAPPPERKAPDRKRPQRGPKTPKTAKPRTFRPAMSAILRKIVYGPVVTLRMALQARGDVLPILDQGLKARYLAGEIGRGRGPPG